MLRGIIALYFISAASAQIFKLGGCPEVEVVSDFDLEQLNGTWYEAARSFTLSELGASCVRTDFNIKNHGSTSYNTSITLPIVGQLSFNGDLEISQIGNSGELRFKMPGFASEQPTSVLDIDDNSYVALFVCNDYTVFNLQFSYIWTRKQNASKEVVQKAKQVYAKNDLDPDVFIDTDQSDCPESSLINVNL